jgi:hypothetical protein
VQSMTDMSQPTKNRNYYGRQVTQMSIAQGLCVLGLAVSFGKLFGPWAAAAASLASALFVLGVSQIIAAVRELESND